MPIPIKIENIKENKIDILKASKSFEVSEKVMIKMKSSTDKVNKFLIPLDAEDVFQKPIPAQRKTKSDIERIKMKQQKKIQKRRKQKLQNKFKALSKFNSVYAQ